MKQDVLEGGIRVPAMLRWPTGLPAGTEGHDMLHFCDWLPTLAAVAGAIPDGRPLDGVNVLPVLQGKSKTGVCQRFWQFNRYDPVLHCNMAMRDGDWKLYWPRIPEAMVKLQSDQGWAERLMREPHFFMPIDNPPVERALSLPQAPELYDLANDPLESQDLAKSHPHRGDRMKLAAENWFHEVEEDRAIAAKGTCR